MYLSHFHFTKHPFSLTPDTAAFCNISSYQEALSSIIYSLEQGQGFVKVVGEVGVGKTMLCRVLLNILADKPFVTVYIPNSAMSPDALHRFIAIELGVELVANESDVQILQKIQDKLLVYRQEDKRVVLLIDEAQALPIESLESIRLLSNLETESEKLLQVILFGQPELDGILNQHAMRQFMQRVTCSLVVKPLNEDQVECYIAKRLVSAGHATGQIFSPKVSRYIFEKTGGIPRVINIVCDKALLVAFSKGAQIVTIADVKRALKDSTHLLETIPQKNMSLFTKGMAVIGVLLVAEIIVGFYLHVY